MADVPERRVESKWTVDDNETQSVYPHSASVRPRFPDCQYRQEVPEEKAASPEGTVKHANDSQSW